MSNNLKMILLGLSILKISKYDRALIKFLHREKNWGPRRLLKKIPSKNWARTNVDRLLQ